MMRVHPSLHEMNSLTRVRVKLPSLATRWKRLPTHIYGSRLSTFPRKQLKLEEHRIFRIPLKAIITITRTINLIATALLSPKSPLFPEWILFHLGVLYQKNALPKIFG